MVYFKKDSLHQMSVFVCLMMMSNPPTLLVLPSEPLLDEPFPFLPLPAPPLSEEYTGQGNKSEHTVAVRLKTHGPNTSHHMVPF